MPDGTEIFASPRPNRRGAAARSRLLDAAVTSFAAKGFHGTGTRDIAGLAGMSPAALYVHYPTKEELLFQISLSGHLEVQRVVEEACTADMAPDDRLRRAVEAFTAWHANSHIRARVIQYEMSALSSEHAARIATIRRAIEARVRGIIDDGVSTQRFRVADSRIAALALLSLGIDVARWYREDGRWTPAEIGKRYGELALGMLSGDGGPRG